ncbi:hypothetical protein LPJ53_003075 [Coemansia erecta]|uniref:Uncharacterized protein n=1 Tax=Coemansia erecta TaxID=147472 RepID=A0A9W8CSD0_9FUNG|nr:hypothetical protein LPJ53_003075 [Coemansia erecta]
MGSQRGHKIQRGRVGKAKAKKPVDARASIQIAKRNNNGNNRPAGSKQQQYQQQQQQQHSNKRNKKPSKTGKSGSNGISIVGRNRRQSESGGLTIAGSSRTAAGAENMEVEEGYTDEQPRIGGISISGRASASRLPEDTTDGPQQQHYHGYHSYSSNGESEQEDESLYAASGHHYTSERRSRGKRPARRRAGGVFAQCLGQVVGQTGRNTGAGDVAAARPVAAAGGEELAVFLHDLGRYMTATADVVARAAGGSGGGNSDAAGRAARRTMPSLSNGISIAGTSRGH